MTNPWRSLTGRTALAAAAAATLAFAIAGGVVLFAAQRAERHALDRDLRGSVNRLTPAARDVSGRRPGLRPAGSPGAALPPVGAPMRPPDADGTGAPARGPANGPPNNGPPLDPGIDRFARIISPDGVVLRAEGATVPPRFPRTAADGRLRTIKVGRKRWRIATVNLDASGQTLQVAALLEPLEKRQSRLRAIVALATLLALAGSIALALTLSRVALQPLNRLRTGAERVRGTHDLSARIDPGGNVAETDALAGELNAMLTRLQDANDEREQALAAARQFAADAGHELRTPLTSLTASLNTLTRGDAAESAKALQGAQGDLTRLTGLVAQLQSLARGDAGLSATAPEIDLGELADAAVASATQRHPELRARLEGPPEGPYLRGDSEGLRGIFDNLLENAALHAGATAQVVVTLAPGLITVDDDGPGIPTAEYGTVLQRFGRGTTTTAPGTGLGLAIVVAQAQRHGGEVGLSTSPSGGLRVTVRLPGTGSAT